MKDENGNPSSVSLLLHPSEFNLRFTMLIPTPALLKGKRSRRKLRASVAGPGALVVTGVPELDYSSVYQLLWVTLSFNTTAEQPLTGVDQASPGKWSARYQGKRFVATGLWQVADDWIQIELEQVGEEAGEDELVYTNNPSDIQDTLGRKLAAFSMPL